MTAPSLTEFLLARIAGDEGVARSAAYMWRDEWSSEDVGVTTHIERHDPAHVLAECEAKRGVVTDPGFRESGRQTLSIFGERILGHLALPYANHPDYRPEWKP